MKQLSTILGFFLLVLSANSQETTPGLFLTLTDSTGKTDKQSVSLAAIYVGAGESASPLLAEGTFSAKWTGFLNLEKRSRLYFSFTGNGKVSLTIDGENILEAAGENLGVVESERHRLSSGLHPIEIKYQSPKTGVSQLRMNWRGRDFAKETVPAKAFFREAGLTEGDQLRKGRNLFAQSGCIQCHTDEKITKSQAMPELLQDAPSFQGIGSRLNKEWMASWIQNPKSHRRNPRMPNLLQNQDAKASQNVAEWLALQTEEASPAPLPPATQESIASGKLLFHTMGCLACHDQQTKNTPAQQNERIQLSNIASKFQNGALRDFLRKPSRHYAWIRMPDFSFTEKEATQLAHYLRSLPQPTKTAPFTGDSQKGLQLIQQTGCLSCHKSGTKNTYSSKPLHALKITTDQGCLSPSPHNAPNYGFSEQQRMALTLFLKKAQPSLAKRSLREFAQRQVDSLQCKNCHPMHGQQPYITTLPDLTSPAKHAPGDVEAEAHAAGQKKGPPDLTLIGEKLRTDWMTQLFEAHLSYKPRPWMKMRMPAFPAQGKLMAEGLAQLHGFAPTPSEPKIKAEWSEIGQKLISTNGGFACVACHAVGKKPALAPFEGQGLNFSYTQERLTHEYYLRWMLNPQRLSPQSIMPRYSDEEGYSTLSDILEGNATDQFNAIWQYLKTGDDL